jgi:hypothetical protein
MLMGFSIPIKFSTFEISNNKFLKITISTFTLKFLNLSTTFKLTCTHITHSFKKNIAETKCFHVSKWKENIKSKITSKSLFEQVYPLSFYIN